LTANFLFGQAYNIDLQMSSIRNGQDRTEREAPNASTSNAIISVFLVVVMPISFTTFEWDDRASKNYHQQQTAHNS